MCNIEFFLYHNIKPVYIMIYIYILYISQYTYASARLAYDLQCKKLNNKICYETKFFMKL